MRRGSVFAVLCLALLAAAPGSAQEKPLKPGDTFRDCPKCPLMRVVPAGRFEMGDRAGIGDIDESSVVKMRIIRSVGPAGSTTPSGLRAKSR